MKNFCPCLLRSVSRVVLVVLVFSLPLGLAAAMEPPPAFLITWGSLGSGDGQFSYPAGVVADTEENIYVADTYNHRIQKFGKLKSDNPFMDVYIDIKPRSSLNPLNVKGKGVLPVAILGTDLLDVTMIDTATIRLRRDGSKEEGGIAPIRLSYEDVASPLEGELHDYRELGLDGYEDLTVKFRTGEVVGAMGEVHHGEEVVLTISGNLLDGTTFEGADSVKIIKKGWKNKKEKKDRKGKRWER